MSSTTTLSVMEGVGQERGIFVPIEICNLKDTTCPHLTLLVYNFDEIVEIIYRAAGRGGDLPKSFDCLRFHLDGNLVYFIEMKRFRELQDRYLSKHPREEHLHLVDLQIDKYSDKIPGKVQGTIEAFGLLQEHLGIEVADFRTKYFVLTDCTMRDREDDYVDLTLYTLSYLAGEETPLDYYVQAKMTGMVESDRLFSGDEKPTLVSCATIEKH